MDAPTVGGYHSFNGTGRYNLHNVLCLEPSSLILQLGHDDKKESLANSSIQVGIKDGAEVEAECGQLYNKLPFQDISYYILLISHRKSKY
ncbi:Hypothetical predicted protein [Octopus vulgaris]|uniref:Uncharacterized protein n=1 Tax=Octopus vulgaris TaxID=6645 RepID=A0AA36B502_OCTVU|nr:Hypothetical predicted protein [Octopus vulgaris]